MAYTIPLNSADREEAAASNSFEPLPAGWYDATIYDVKVEEYTDGPYKGTPRYNVQYRIASGTYENRRIFERVSMLGRWAPSAKSPKGSVNFTFFGFFKALGYDLESDSFSLPTPNELGGQALQIKLKVVPDSYNGGNKNEIAAFKASEGAVGATAGITVGDSAGATLASVLGASEVPSDSPWKVS